MYSITNVIVGVPITLELSELIDQWESDGDPRWKEWEDLGFVEFYHGGAQGHMGFCGVQLGEFDECGVYVVVRADALFYHTSKTKSKKIPLTPNQNQLDEAHRLVQAVNPELLKLCPPFGVYFVQSTS